MNPVDRRALDSRFPELQGMGQAPVADAFQGRAFPTSPQSTGTDGASLASTSAAPRPTPTPEQLLAAAARAEAAGDTGAAARLRNAAQPTGGGENPFRQFAPQAQASEANPFAKFSQGNAPAPVTASELLKAAQKAEAAGDYEAAKRLMSAAQSIFDQPQGTKQFRITAPDGRAYIVAGSSPEAAMEAFRAQRGEGQGQGQGRAADGPLEPPPAYGSNGMAAEPTAPRPDTFGDTVAEATAAPRAAMSAFRDGLLDQSRSPTMAALPEAVPNALRGVVAGAGDLGGLALSGLGTAIAGGAGLVGELVGQNPTQERKLARDLLMGAEVAVPELAGVSGTVRAGGAAVRAAERLGMPAKPGQAAARAAGDLGITPSAGMSGKTTAMISAGLEKVPFAGDVIAKDAARAVGEVERVFSRIRGSVGNALSSSAAGTTLQEGLRGFVKGFQDTSTKLFNAVDRNIPASARFTLDNTSAALGDAKAAFDGNPELAARLGVNRWDAILSEAQQNGVTWQALKQFRTSVGEAIGAAQSGRQGGALAGDDLGRLKRLYGALTTDMTAAAQSVGKDAFSAWQRANGHYRAGAERIERSLDATITAQSPERAWEAFSALLQRDRASSDLTRVRAIRASLNRDEWDTVAASIVDRMGRAPVGQQNAAGDAFSPSSFLTNWNKLDPQSRALLLPQEARLELEKLAKVAERMKAGNAERNTSNTGTAGWVATLFLGGVTDLGTTAAVLGATNVSARALTSTTFLKAMNAAARGDAKMLRAMANGNGPFKKDAATVIGLAAADQATPEPEGRKMLKVTAPDGTTFNLNVRANASPDEVLTAVRQAIAQRKK